MLRYILPLLTILSLLITACNKDGNTKIEQPNTGKLSKIVINYNGGISKEIQYEYGENGYISKSRHSYIDNLNNEKSDSYTETYFYNTENQLDSIYIEHPATGNNALSQIKTFYNYKHGLMVHKSSHPFHDSDRDGSVDNISNDSFSYYYEYDDNQNLKKYKHINYNTSAPILFEYNKNTLVRTYEEGTGNSNTVTFDEQKNPLKRMLPKNAILPFSLYDLTQHSFSSEHNLIKGLVSNQSTYKYEYNAEGYPTKCSIVDNNGTTTTNYFYN